MSIITFPEAKDHPDVLKVVNNVRDLKIVIDFANKKAYRKYKGEISRTDILYASVLRNYQSGLFWDFIKEHFFISNDIIAAVKKVRDEKEGNSLKDTPEWKNLSQTVGDEYVSNALYNLVIALLEGDRIQSPASADKYKRILEAAIDEYELPNTGLSDQEYLNTIKQWKSGQREPFVTNLITTKEWCDSFEYFQKYIANDESEYNIRTIGEMMKLVSEFNKAALEQLSNQANSNTCHGFIPLWRVFINGPYRRAELWKTDRVKWILEQGSLAMSTSLSFVLDFDYYWLSGNGDLFNQEEASEIRQSRIKLFFSLFENDINKFLAVLPDNVFQDGRLRLYQFIEHTYTTRETKRFPLDENDKSRVLKMIYTMFEIDPEKTSILTSTFFVDAGHDFRDADIDPDTGNYLQGRNPQTIYTFNNKDLDIFRKELLDLLRKKMPLSLRESDPFCRAIFEGRVIQNLH